MSKPLIFTPRAYGQMITDHQLDRPRNAVWAGMGMGKTVSTLNALDIKQLIDDQPVLVLAPLRVATTTWPDEARKWAHLRHLHVVPIVGNENQRRAALRQDANIFTTNYEQLPWLVEHYKDRWPFAEVVIDESTKLKGFRLRQGTQRAKALAQVAHTKVKRITELTGTPSPNGLMDLWGQIWFLDKGERLGRTFDAFKQRWFRAKYDGYGVEALDHAQAQIQAALRDLCLTIEAKDWFDLREPIVNNIYVDLPAKARALYEDMEKRMFMELAGHEVEAFGAAARTVKCVAGDTDLLTSNGWKRLDQWVPGDKLWDGIEWVSADSLVCNGVMPVVKCLHVTMTPAHKVLTTDGWKTAEEINYADASCGFNRAPVRVPDCVAPGRDDAEHPCEEGHLGGSVHLRGGVDRNRDELNEPEQGRKEVVRMPSGRDACAGMEHPRHDEYGSVGLLAEHGVALPQSAGPRLAQLRRAGDQGLPKVDDLRVILDGDGAVVPRGADDRARGQQRGLYLTQLPVGDTQRAGEQYAAQCVHRHAGGAHDGQPGGRPVRGQEGDTSAAPAAWLADGSGLGSTTVYDLVNCGPRHRFTVRGTDGNLLLVHNCLQIANGAAYVGETSSEWRDIHDAKLDALDEVIEEACGMPVLVAYNFKSDLARLLKAFPDGIALNTAENLRRAQRGEGRVWFGHPASMGHGVDGLQEHCNILAFFGHDWNLENRLQIIERIGPTRQMQAGHDRPMFIHNLIARDTVDELVIERVNTKRETQDILMEAMKVKGYR